MASSSAEYSNSTQPSSRTPLLPSDNRHITHASDDFISTRLLKTNSNPSSYAVRLRHWLQWFLTSKYGHYTVLVLVALDIAGIFADFLISLHICEHTCGGKGDDANLEFWSDFDDALDIVSLVFSSLFMVELLGSIYAFGLGYFKSKFHILDATSIVASFLVDVLLHGPLEEAGSLVIVLRLFRVFKIIEETSTAAEESMDELHERIEHLEKENAALKQHQLQR